MSGDSTPDPAFHLRFGAEAAIELFNSLTPEGKDRIRALLAGERKGRPALCVIVEGASIPSEVATRLSTLIDEQIKGRSEFHQLLVVDSKQAPMVEHVENFCIARPLDEWCEQDGPALWWKFPIVEPPYSGSPLCDNFPDYVTHWTRIPLPLDPSSKESDR